MEAITELLQMIQAVFGVEPADFAMVSMTVAILVVILRRCLQFQTKLARINKTEWGKIVLTLATLALGILLAFVAQYAKIYTVRNTPTLVWVGFWNGALSSLFWQGAKRFPALRQFAEGKDKP